MKNIFIALFLVSLNTLAMNEDEDWSSYYTKTEKGSSDEGEDDSEERDESFSDKKEQVIAIFEKETRNEDQIHVNNNNNNIQDQINNNNIPAVNDKFEKYSKINVNELRLKMPQKFPFFDASYEEIFVANHIDGITFAYLTLDKLKDMGILIVGHRLRIYNLARKWLRNMNNNGQNNNNNQQN